MDRIIFGYAFEGKLRFSAANMKWTVEEARLRHSLSPIATAALGRALIGSALAIPWLGETETLTIDIEANGDIKRIVAQSRGNFTVRGYVANPLVEGEVKDGKFNIAGIVKGGMLRVVRDLGLKTPHTSQVPIKSGEIAQDLAYYYTVSEQLPTAIALGVLVGKDGVISAGGYALQIIEKNLDERVIRTLEENVSNLGSVTSHLSKGENIADILFHLLGDNFGDYTEHEIKYQCTCNREKARDSLMVLSIQDLQQMIEEGIAEVTCKWCGKRYYFEEDEIKEILLGKDV